ncbi:MAG: phosphatidylserine decarboxylase family protein [Bacteroidales bacterium]|nr:phosphatidylserine decarboxylase family protein [Bacteroidales bacterium]
MTIRIHKEGKGVITIAVLITVAFAILIAAFLSLYISVPLITVLVILLTLIIRFFRIPDRHFVSDEHTILAPADGKVVAIERVVEKEFFKDERTLVSIFMSIYNVHINWFPISGKISYFKYHPGKYLVARHPKSSELNEHTTTVIENNRHQVMVKQIAGFVARRIIAYVSTDNNAVQSQEMGFIRFGSRLDIYLPTEAEISVDLNQKTLGGITPIARFK